MRLTIPLAALLALSQPAYGQDVLHMLVVRYDSAAPNQWGRLLFATHAGCEDAMNSALGGLADHLPVNALSCLRVILDSNGDWQLLQDQTE